MLTWRKCISMTEALQHEGIKKLERVFKSKKPASITMFGGGLAGVPQIVPVAASLTNKDTLSPIIMKVEHYPK